MSLFDPSPKSDPRFLYSRDKELNDLATHLRERLWIILLGPRRIGKTSLARCALAKLGYRYLVIDSRENSDLAQALTSSFISSERSFQAQAGVALPPLSISVSYSKTWLKDVLDSFLRKIDRLVVLIDEAQWLRNPRGVAMLLAHIYDYHYDKVTLIITGSAVGVMKSITEPGARSPLYGRAMTRMEIQRWSPSVSLGFLREGCREKRLSFNESFMVKVVDTLDGIPGWLTLFGYNYSLNPKQSDTSLKRTLDEAMKIVAEEIESVSKIAAGWARQMRVLRELSKGPKRFSELAQAASLTNQALSRHTDMLERLHYIEKNQNSKYMITDPILEEFVRHRRA